MPETVSYISLWVFFLMSEFIIQKYFLRVYIDSHVHANVTLQSMVTISTFSLIKQNYEADLASLYCLNAQCRLVVRNVILSFV